MEQVQLQYTHQTLPQLMYQSSAATPLCKHCGTTEITHFYKGNLKSCKVCRDPKNRIAGISSKTKLQDKEAKCSSCGIIKDIEYFDMSASGFRHTKCQLCRIAGYSLDEIKSTLHEFHLLTLQRDTNCIDFTAIISTTSDKHQNDQLKNNEFKRLKQFVIEAGYTKQTMEILAAVLIDLISQLKT